MKRTITYLFCFLFVTSCESQVTSEKNMKWDNGMVLFIHDDGSDSLSRRKYESSFYSVDTLGSNHGPMLFVGDSNHVTIKHPLWFRQLKTQIPFLVFPCDTISIEKDKNGDFIFQSKLNKIRNNELSFFPEIVRKTGFLIDPKAIWSANDMNELSLFFRSILEKRDTRTSILDAELNNHKISDDFYESADRFIKYTYIDNKLDLILWNKKLLKQFKLYSKYFDSCLQEVERLPFDSSFIGRNVYYKLVDIGTDRGGEINNANDLQKSMDFVSAKINGPMKEYLLLGLLYGAMFNMSVPESAIQQYDSISKNIYYKEIVHRIIVEQAAQIANGNNVDKLLLSDYSTVKSLRQVITKNKGKLLLLDFWASWCLPCRQEIPALKALENKYKDKDISFYSISIDSKIYDWKTALREENIIKGNNTLLLNAEKSSFRQHYKISAIPRYLLIGKDGQLIASDAPRPSDKALEKLIEDNL